MSGGAGGVEDLAARCLRAAAEIDRPEVILEGMTRERALVLARLAAVASSAARPGAAGGRRTRADAGERAPADGGERTPADGGERTPVGGGRTRGEPTADTPAPDIVADDAIAAAPDLAALGRLVGACTRCPLHATRASPVFGEGDPGARVVCVGEAPGAREDQTGRPFVGRAGQLLDRLLLTIGLPRQSVYICNVLKSRPPNNRDPLPEEVNACSPYLLRQLALIEPEVIVAFGAFAARTLLDTKGALGRLRGSVHEYAGYPVVVTYHPAALLRNPGWTRPAWEDLQIVRGILDTSDGTGGRGGDRRG